MPRMLARAGILVALLSPSLAFAAYNDVTLTTSTVFSVGGISLNVSGSSASVQSVVVNATNMVITLLPSSSITIVAPSRNTMTQAGGSDYLTTNQCDSTASKMVFQGGGSVATVTLTPAATLCAGGTAGGGGTAAAASSVSSAVVAPAAVVSTTPVVTTATTTTPTATPVTAAPRATKPSGLSATQVQSILDVLASFNADAATIASVKSSLGGMTAGSVTSATGHVFSTNLTMGSLGSEVKALQQYLNAHGYTISAKGAGSLGNETMKFGAGTRAALMKYQKAHGISPASGYFGAQTRAAMNAGN